MRRHFIGIDNGVSGSIGIISDISGVLYFSMPIWKDLSYTKKKQWVNRVKVDILLDLLTPYSLTQEIREQTIVLLERPMVNPARFKASESALRCLEATLIAIEKLELPYNYLDSKEWQKVLLPSNLKGPELKTASLRIGKRLFPTISFSSFKDADGLLIAEYARRKNTEKNNKKVDTR